MTSKKEANSEKNAKIDHSKIEKFIKGISEYVLGKFYLRLKRQHEDKIPKELLKKLKAVFAVIKSRQTIDF